MKRQISLGIFGVWTALSAIPSAAIACAVCLTGDASDPLADAFNWSVLFLMAAPYLVVGSIAGWLFFAYWRGAATAEQGAAAEPPVGLT